MALADTTNDRVLRRAVFLDKDGTLVENVPYNVRPEAITLSEGAVTGLRLLQAAGYHLIVVSNQSGVARGYFEEAALASVELRVRELLEADGVQLDGWRYCPHHPEGTVAAYRIACDCRKPAPGMLRQAAADHGLSLRDSWMVGDILDDVEAGNRAGCRTVLIDNGNETEWVRTPHREPHLRATNLAGAARAILAFDRVTRREPRQPSHHARQPKARQ